MIDDEDLISFDEPLAPHAEWEQRMLKIYEERATSRSTIFVHVIVTAFCQLVLCSLLFREMIGTSLADFRQMYGVMTKSIGLIVSSFICTVILHLSQ